MSNVLLGVISVILFIGMAIAGATYFGPRVSEASIQGGSSIIITELVSIATAVQVRDRENEMATRAGTSTSFLAPQFLQQTPRNPTFGPEPMLLSGTGDLTGVAQFAAMKVTGTNTDKLCDEINRTGKGSVPAPTLAGPPSRQTYGAYKVNRDLTPQILQNSCVAYAIIP